MKNNYIRLISKSSLQNIFNSFHFGYAVFEEIHIDSSICYKLVEANDVFSIMLGKSIEDVLGKNISELFYKNDDILRQLFIKEKNTTHYTHYDVIEPFDGKYYIVSVLSCTKGKFSTVFVDVTTFKKAESAYKKHKLLFDCAQDIILYVKENGNIIDANDSACKMYKYSMEELTKLSIHDISNMSIEPKFEEQMEQADKSGIIFESIHIRKDGSTFPVEVSSKGTIINNEKIKIFIIRDITQRKNAENKIQFLANYDALTGVANRGNLINQLEIELSRAKRGKYKVAIMFFDIDKFKQINDAYGHYAGDIVLKRVATKVKSLIRKVDIIGRFGGDEFVIIQPLLDNGKVIPLVERIFQAFEKPINIAGKELLISISLGISFYPDNSKTVDGLIKCSDKAMYLAKKESGNSYRLYT